MCWDADTSGDVGADADAGATECEEGGFAAGGSPGGVATDVGVVSSAEDLGVLVVRGKGKGGVHRLCTRRRGG